MPEQRGPQSDSLVWRACDLFFREKRKVAEIAKRLSTEFERRVTREAVYPLIAEGRDLGYVFFRPPVSESLASRIAEKYELNEEHITVVAAEG